MLLEINLANFSVKKIEPRLPLPPNKKGYVLALIDFLPLCSIYFYHYMAKGNPRAIKMVLKEGGIKFYHTDELLDFSRLNLAWPSDGPWSLLLCIRAVEEYLEREIGGYTPQLIFSVLRLLNSENLPITR